MVLCDKVVEVASRAAEERLLNDFLALTDKIADEIMETVQYEPEELV